MKRRIPSKILVALMGVVSLSSCTIDDLVNFIFGFDKEMTASNVVSMLDEGDGYYRPSTAVPYFSYRDIQRNLGLDAIPSSGDCDILVIPVQLSGYPFTSQTIDDLDKVFNGSGKEETGYWESLSSFYKKSSYGKLNLTFEIADIFSTSYTPKSLFNAHASQTNNATNELLRAAVANYKKANGSSSTKKFDHDGDGQIDGVVMVYSCPDSMSNNKIHEIDPNASLFWAYTYWDYKEARYTADKNSPIGNNYFWMSYDFIYEAVSSPKVDPHTLIHETGHMLGLDDYYASQNDGYSDYNPAGGWSMMDENILDLDIYSKMALGWANPFVITGECTININPSESSGDCILIPTSSGWNGSAFDEYLLLELYTPTDLNYLDSHTAYKNREKHYTTHGIKLYHIDARMVKTKTSDQVNWSYASETRFNNGYFYEVGATNCHKSRGYVNSKFDLIRMISADNANTFHASSLSNEASLFKKGSSFSMSKYSKFFPNSSLFNSGAKCSFSIDFQEVAADHATITFKAI